MSMISGDGRRWADPHVGDLARLLSRNAERLAGSHPGSAAGPALWIDLPADAPLARLAAPDSLLVNDDYRACMALRRAGARAVHGQLPTPGRALSDIVLCLPREKERLAMLAHACAHLLTPDGRLWALGENRSGARTAGRRLGEYFERVEKADSARHCTLWAATDPRKAPDFAAEDYRRRRRLEMEACGQRVTLEVHSWPGVFAGGGLDPGTALLLRALPMPSAGERVLDFACGAGIIGAAIARLQPGVELDALDSSALACRSADATFQANGVRATVFGSDGFGEARGPYDLVLSNPPFHRGHRADPSLTPRLLAQAGNFLAPGGRLILVANRHLPYARWLQETFRHHCLLDGDQRYHVHLAEN